MIIKKITAVLLTAALLVSGLCICAGADKLADMRIDFLNFAVSVGKGRHAQPAFLQRVGHSDFR